MISSPALTMIGCQMYDCVYPTRTARFGVALVPGRSPGTLRLRARGSALNDAVIQNGCMCQACRHGVSRARLHSLLKTNNPLAVELITQHNIAYMMQLVRGMRQAILDGTYGEFVRSFVIEQYPGDEGGGESCPKWVVDALGVAGINIDQ